MLFKNKPQLLIVNQPKPNGLTIVINNSKQKKKKTPTTTHSMTNDRDKHNKNWQQRINGSEELWHTINKMKWAREQGPPHFKKQNKTKNSYAIIMIID